MPADRADNNFSNMKDSFGESSLSVLVLRTLATTQRRERRGSWEQQEKRPAQVEQTHGGLLKTGWHVWIEQSKGLQLNPVANFSPPQLFMNTKKSVSLGSTAVQQHRSQQHNSWLRPAQVPNQRVTAWLHTEEGQKNTTLQQHGRYHIDPILVLPLPRAFTPFSAPDNSYTCTW